MVGSQGFVPSLRVGRLLQQSADFDPFAVAYHGALLFLTRNLHGKSLYIDMALRWTCWVASGVRYRVVIDCLRSLRRSARFVAQVDVACGARAWTQRRRFAAIPKHWEHRSRSDCACTMRVAVCSLGSIGHFRAIFARIAKATARASLHAGISMSHASVASK